MLIVNDRSLLNDGRIDEHESLAKIKEGNRKLVEKFRMPGQAELEDVDRSSGARMSYREIIRRLRNINLNIKAVDGSPDSIALYVLKTRKEMAESANEPNDPTKYDWYKDFKYVTGCPKGFIPEYGAVTVDERGVAKREEPRGWRSLLIALVKSRAITYQQAQEEFGPAMGKRSWRYEEQLQQYRQGF
jgi:hypothetical protein